MIANLAGWEAPDWQLPGAQADAALPNVRYEVAVDPELGRFVILNRPLPQRVEVSYAYGFGGDIGGGPYNRLYNRPRSKAMIPSPKSVLWTVKQQSLQSAIEQWHYTTETWEACRNHTYIPLAKLQVPTLPWIDLEPEVRSHFQPGIITGLEVLATPGASAVIVNRGEAIDIQGRLISVDQPVSILLDRYKNQTVIVAAIYHAPSLEDDSPTFRIEVISATLAADHSDRIYIRLCLIAININGQIISHSTAQRMTFQPGIVAGLNVKLNKKLDRFIITQGLAVDQKGQRIRLQAGHQILRDPDQNQIMVLVLSRRMELGKLDREERRGQQWQLDWVADSDLERYPAEIFLPLTRLPASPKKSDAAEVQDGSASDSIQLRPTFRSGIVWGLSVIAYPGQNRAIVTPGVAVGLRGETISIPENRRLRLRGFPNQTVTIYLVYQTNAGGSIVALSTPPNTPALKLATLILDPQGRVRELPDLSRRIPFTPGILQPHTSLTVTAQLDAKHPQVAIAPGTAIDVEGRSLTLSTLQTFDLSNYRGQTLLLFLAYQVRQGWQLGVVVEEAEVGKIEFQDSATYGIQDLSLTIPAGKQLYIMAGDGCRPHMQGNLAIQGSGELWIDGLLIEGQVKVLPGELKRLRLSHCTLVPQGGGFLVQALPRQGFDPELNEWSMITLVMYYVHLIWKLTAINLNSQLTPSQMLTQLIQVGTQRIRYLIMDLWQSCHTGRSSNVPLFSPSASTEDNDQLSIEIDRCICGSIQIEATIAQISIDDSIVDARDRGAIVALSSHVVCNNTTILGSTTVLSIEATNTLFTDRVAVWRQQIGHLRFCYAPDESQTPYRYRCQPDQVFDRLDRLPAKVTALASDRTVLFAGTAIGEVWRSVDSGDSWQPLQNGLINLPVQTIAINPHDRRVYVGTTEGYLFSMQNNSDRWEPLIQLHSDVVTRDVGFNTTAINQIAIKDAQLFVATLGGRIFRSSDWTASPRGLEQAIWNINTVAVHPQTGWIFAGTAGTGIYYSQDNGETWQKPPSLNLTNQMITALAVDRHGKIFAGTTGIFTKDSGIFYSTNNGDSWTFVRLAINQRNITAIVIHPLNDAIFVGTVNGGLLRSQDAGQTWQALSNLPHLHITALTITEADAIVAGTAGGAIWRSTDHGNNWTPINSDFNNAQAKLLLLNQLQPSFTSTQYGDPGYAQLSLTCANEICIGGEDSAEMGCFNSLKQPQRKANLQTSLKEYVRFGLEVTLFYIT
ncbi:MAG: hypothetical protein HC780_06000 [Leptolyngbyaceae cyanobacterium CSU_1_3]|nr:hypothetical protein [Leptolyngbyaceae cyanobacterium CSU_1_3]